MATIREIMRGVAAGLLLTASFSAHALLIGQIDTFQDGTTDQWFAGGLGGPDHPPIAPHNVATGGPAGAGDAFLEITASTQNGAGSRVVAINGAQWAGNYLAAGVHGIAMDVANLGQTALTVRLLFEDPKGGPPVDEGVTTLGFALAATGAWQHIFFPISPAALTMIDGNANTLLGQTTLLRIINSPTPDDAIAQVGVLGVDNIQAVPLPGTLPLLGAALVLLGRFTRGKRRDGAAEAA